MRDIIALPVVRVVVSTVSYPDKSGAHHSAVYRHNDDTPGDFPDMRRSHQTYRQAMEYHHHLTRGLADGNIVTGEFVTPEEEERLRKYKTKK